MKQLWGLDGKIVTDLNRTWDLAVLNAVWLICCIPIVTIVPATAAFYYAVFQNIRQERGKPLQKYFYEMKRNFRKCWFLSLLEAALGTVIFIWWNFAAAFPVSSMEGIIYRTVSRALLLMALLVSVFLPGIIARLECSWKEYIRLTAFLGFRHICRSVLLIMMGILGFLIFYIFPPVIVILPGTAVLLSTYLIEPVLNKYTGVREESMDEHR